LKLCVSRTVSETFSIKEWRDLQTGDRSLSRSLERPYTTIYWSAIVYVALSGIVLELFDIKKYCDLENWVRGCSRSLKMAPFDRPYIGPPL